MTATHPILIGFDGSEGSERAITVVAQLFPGADVVVAHVWHLPNLYTAGYAGAAAIPRDVLEDVEAAAKEQANETVERGKELAQRAGLAAEGFAYVTPSAPWRHLLGTAEDVGAKVIVVGSRGLGGVKSLVLGSTSQGLAHHSKLPLLIVPAHSEG